MNNKTSKIKNAFVDFVLVFLFLSDFTLPLIYRSSLLVFLFLFVLYWFNAAFQKNTTLIFRNKFTQRVFLFYFGIIILAFLIPIFHGTYDFSFVPTLFANLLSLIIGIFLIAFIYRKKNRHIKYVVNLIVAVFIIQSLIIFGAFIHHGFRTFVQSFNPSVDNLIDREIGFRAMALSNATVARLGAFFAIGFIVYFYKLMLKGKKIAFWDIAGLIIVILGNFFASRTGFIGLFIGIIFYMFYSFSSKKAFKGLIYTGIGISCLVYSYQNDIMGSEIEKTLDEKILPWVFEAYYTYEKTGAFTTGSTESLFSENHYFFIPFHTLMFGDGRYGGLNGGYYGSTDAGWMRVVLYGGVFFQLSMLLWAIYILKPLRLSPSIYTRALFYMLILFTILYQLKSVAIGYATFNNRIMFLIAFFLLLYNLKIREINKASFSRYSHAKSR